jgi:hypothetical protein
MILYFPKQTIVQETFMLHWMLLHEPRNKLLFNKILDKVNKMSSDEVLEFHKKTEPLKYKF